MPVGEVNVEKIGQMYGIAQQLMSLTSEFMQNGRAYGSQTYSSSRNGEHGNSILNEVVSARRTLAPSDEKLTLYNEYGGLGSSSPSGRPKSGIQSILNTFLGSSMNDFGRGSFLDFFGLGAPTEPPTTTTAAPPPASPMRNMMEMFGFVRPTPPPTTTQRPASIMDFFASPEAYANVLQNFQQQPQLYQPQQVQTPMNQFYSPPRSVQPSYQQNVQKYERSPAYGYDQYGRAPQLVSPQIRAPTQPSNQQMSLNDFQSSAINYLQDPRSKRQQRYILDTFLGGSTEQAKPQQRAAPIVNMLEMFGLMEKTTTTQRPRLFDSRSGFGMGTKGASDIDNILNALMRGGVKVAEPEAPSPAGILSQFFG
ncbi:unnamed protein product, partial [Mesorhabditis belari]|uniref:Uncharacterized protein n=1 Tax=Mesorhabditis belari TaxID=2138241 RepID=A0AAF3EKX7_9BILA